MTVKLVLNITKIKNNNRIRDVGRIKIHTR